MDAKEFREFGKAAIDYIADYIENIRERPVLPSVEAGYLRKLMPAETPEKGGNWKDFLDDLEKCIMPGNTHWVSPNFHAYYPSGNSFPSMVGDLIANGIESMGLSWSSSPACTELEVIMMNWLGKLLDLPEQFLNCSKGTGGGVLQSSASETTLIVLIAAKERTVNRLLKLNPDLNSGQIKAKLVAYTSNQSNSSVEKAGNLGSMTMRLLPVDDESSLRGDTLRKAVEEDVKNGLIPCYLVATLGTTATCAFDNLDELGDVCRDFDIWMHVDAAYAGAAFVLPEYRHWMKGLEKADSFNFNPQKWLLVSNGCSAMWVKNAEHLVEAFSIDRIYLPNSKELLEVAPDYRHWQISLGKRFKSLKLWAVLQLYGAEGIRKHIRDQIQLAKLFADFLRSDDRFEIIPKPVLGLVCFRIKNDSTNKFTRQLLEILTDRKNIYMVPGMYRNKFIIRFVICAWTTQRKDIEFAWKEICYVADNIVLDYKKNFSDSLEVFSEKKRKLSFVEEEQCKKIISG